MALPCPSSTLLAPHPPGLYCSAHIQRIEGSTRALNAAGGTTTTSSSLLLVLLVLASVEIIHEVAGLD